ncbi:MAG: dTMP kinase [Microgenomates group bacterium]
MRGIFITFEGPEGGGKSLQIEKLKEYLQETGREVVVVREPGQTSIGEQIRQILLNPKNKEMEPRAETLLFESARAQLVEEVIKPALAVGKIVLADRFFDSTTAYQGYGRGMNLKEIDWLNRFATGGLVPDLTILLDVPVEVGLERRRKSGKEDRLDKEGLEFHQRVREGYLKIAKSQPERWRVVNASRSPEEIFEEIKGLVEEKLKEIQK